MAARVVSSKLKTLVKGVPDVGRAGATTQRGDERMTQTEQRDAHLVRLGPPAKGDTIHLSTCRYAQRPNALHWLWPEGRPFDEWARVPWFRYCRVCDPTENWEGSRS